MIKKIFFTSLIIFGILIFPKQVFAASTPASLAPDDAKKIIDKLKKQNIDVMRLEFPDGITRNAFFVYYPGELLPEDLTGVTRHDMNWNSPFNYPGGVSHRFGVKDLQKAYPYFIFSEAYGKNSTYTDEHRYMVSFYKTSNLTIFDSGLDTPFPYYVYIPKDFTSSDNFPLKRIVFYNAYMDNSDVLFVDNTSQSSEELICDFTCDDIGDYYRSSNFTNIISSNIDLTITGTNEPYTNYNKVDFSESIKGDSFGGLGGINSVTDIINKIPELIGDLVASFSLVGLLFTTLLGSFPPIVTVGLYSVFTIGIIILLIKVMT